MPTKEEALLCLVSSSLALAATATAFPVLLRRQLVASRRTLLHSSPAQELAPDETDATVIRKAYKRLALETHPDKCGGSEESYCRFRSVAEAYERLTSTEPDAEDRYAEQGDARAADLFRDLFRRAWERRAAEQDSSDERGGGFFGGMFGSSFDSGGGGMGGSRRSGGGSVYVFFDDDLGTFSFSSKRPSWLSELEAVLSHLRIQMEQPLGPDFREYVAADDHGAGFFDVFAPGFENLSCWSKRHPVPCLGNASTPLEDVPAFYGFWRRFKSTRTFRKELPGGDGNAGDRKIRERAVRAFERLICEFVDSAEQSDPRLLSKAAAAAATKAASAAAAAENAAYEKQAEAESAQAAATAAATERFERSAAKLAKERARKEHQRARKAVRAVAERRGLTDVDRLQPVLEALDLSMLAELARALETTARPEATLEEARRKAGL